MRDDRERLLDIMEAIAKIEERIPETREAFERDELVQVWMAHYIQIIGEAASQISDALMQRHPEIPWQSIVGMRNILVHAYFKVDFAEIWSVMEKDISPLRLQIQAILDAEKQS